MPDDKEKQEKVNRFTKEAEALMKVYNLRIVAKLSANDAGIFPVLSIEEFDFAKEEQTKKPTILTP